jgi:hypothetical protein
LTIDDFINEHKVPEFKPEQRPEAVFVIIYLALVLRPDLADQVVIEIIAMEGIFIENNFLADCSEVVAQPLIDRDTETALFSI